MVNKKRLDPSQPLNNDYNDISNNNNTNLYSTVLIFKILFLSEIFSPCRK